MAGNPSLKSFVLWTCRLLLAGVFAYAAILKIIDPADFVRDLAHYRLLPHPLTLVVALYLPWLELICSIGVLCRWRERGALLLTTVMCGFFCAALASAWFPGLDLNCGCFGHSTAPSDLPLAIARSLALGYIAFFLFRRIQPKARRLGAEAR